MSHRVRISFPVFGVKLQYLGISGPDGCHITTVELSFWRTFRWHIQIFFEEFCPNHFLCNLPITVISGLSSEDSDDLKKILSFSTPRFYLDLIEKSSNLCLWFSLTIFHTLSLQTCLLYCQVEKPRPVSMVQTVWFYDLCGIHNRCSKSKARHQWRGGNQAFVAEWEPTGLRRKFDQSHQAQIISPKVRIFRYFSFFFNWWIIL